MTDRNRRFPLPRAGRAPRRSAPGWPRPITAGDPAHRPRGRRLLLAVLGAALAAGVALVAPAAADTPVGVDVASYQHPNGQPIDWSQVASAGQRFVFAKATEGVSYTNPYFASDRSQALASGLGVGAYDFANPADDPAAEARYFLSVTGTAAQRGTLPPVLDLEQTAGRTPAQVTSWALTWLSTVQAATGRTPIVYSYPYFLRYSITPDTRLAQYPLWIASYSGTSSPPVPAPWTTWLFWQYTDQGSVPGIAGSVDQSRYNGTLLGLQRLALMVPPIPTGDMFGTGAAGTGSGKVEVHALSRSSGYRTFTNHIATGLAQVSNPADWAFFYAPYNGSGRHDLFGVHYANTGSGRVELHVLSEASGYQTFVAHVATALAAVPAGQWQFAVTGYAGDGGADLYAIHYQGGASGHVEVHVLAGSGGYQQWLLHAATALSSTPPGQFSYLVGDRFGSGDLLALERYGTGSGHTEAHTLSRSSSYHTFSGHVATPLGPTASPWIQFTLADANGDGVPDLVMALLQNTGSNSTELHALSGATGYGTWLLHTGTALPTLNPADWAAGLFG